jgi:CHAD domain-containing protein
MRRQWTSWAKGTHAPWRTLLYFPLGSRASSDVRGVDLFVNSGTRPTRRHAQSAGSIRLRPFARPGRCRILQCKNFVSRDQCYAWPAFIINRLLCTGCVDKMVTRPTKSSSRRKAVVQTNLDCASAFRKIALDCIAAIEAHHEAACAGSAEAVHQLRVAITRLRTAVAFFAPIASDAEWRRLKAEIVWLNGYLGAARDSDVMLAQARRKQYRSWADGAFGNGLDRRRTQHHRRLLRCLRSVRFRRLIAAMAEWVDRGPSHPGGAETRDRYCKRELDRWRKRLIRKGRHLETLDAARRHRLRIRIKRFRYMLEALTETVPVYGRGDLRHLYRPAKRLQRMLGDLRDVERLAGLAGKKLPPGYRGRKDMLLEAASEAYRDLKQAGAC